MRDKNDIRVKELEIENERLNQIIRSLEKDKEDNRLYKEKTKD